MNVSNLTATITFETWLSFIKIAKGNTTTATNQYRKCFRFLPMSCSHVIIVFHTFKFVTDYFLIPICLFQIQPKYIDKKNIWCWGSMKSFSGCILQDITFFKTRFIIYIYTFLGTCLSTWNYSFHFKNFNSASMK